MFHLKHCCIFGDVGQYYTALMWSTIELSRKEDSDQSEATTEGVLPINRDLVDNVNGHSSPLVL